MNDDFYVSGYSVCTQQEKNAYKKLIGIYTGHTALKHKNLNSGKLHRILKQYKIRATRLSKFIFMNGMMKGGDWKTLDFILLIKIMLQIIC